MKKQILSLVLIGLATFSFSQTNKNIIVSHAGSDEAYAYLDSAIIDAPDGAVIYVPGRIHTFSTEMIIDKQLHFKGDGHYANTLAGNVPQISGQTLTLKRGTNNSSFEGINFSNTVKLEHEVTDTIGDFNLVFKRCKLDNNITATGGNTFIGNISIALTESVIHGFDLGTTIDAVYLDNCIITGSFFYDVDQGHIKNSIQSYGYLTLNSDNISISNSIFFGDLNTNGINNTISYSLFKTGETIDVDITSSNIIYDDWVNIFVNAPNNNFSQGNDYHLQAASPGIGAGSDGTNMGLYGGPNPWKEHSIPTTPNVYHKAVSNQNDSMGNLNVTYKVKAQGN